METIYLVRVTPDNVNRFCTMQKNNDQETFTAEFGRVGRKPAIHTYELKKWDSLYVKYISDGFVDQTSIMQGAALTKQSQYKPIENAAIKGLVDDLLKLAKQSIKKNYNVSAILVTQTMIDEAQKIINQLVIVKDIQPENVNCKLKEFNEGLIKLFATIPRSMGKVSKYLQLS